MLAAHRRGALRAGPERGLRRVERIVAGEEAFEEVEVVVAEEEFAIDAHRGHAEHARRERVRGLRAQAMLRFGRLRGGDERRAVEPCFVRDRGDDGGVRRVAPIGPTARKSPDTRRARAASSRSSDEMRSASSGLKGWNAGGRSATPSSFALRRLLRAIQRIFGGTSAGPSWP